VNANLVALAVLATPPAFGEDEYAPRWIDQVRTTAASLYGISADEVDAVLLAGELVLSRDDLSLRPDAASLGEGQLVRLPRE